MADGIELGTLGVVALFTCTDGIVVGVLGEATRVVEFVTFAEGIVMGALEEAFGVVNEAVGAVELVKCRDGIV